MANAYVIDSDSIKLPKEISEKLKLKEGMEYSILIEKITEEDFPEGYYYAHIPSIDLTTHGYGTEGAKKAAVELVTLWVQEKAENNEHVHVDLTL